MKTVKDGIIIKGIGGFYYVKTDIGIFECHARGKFRKMKLSPIVGDKVEISLSETEEGIGSIENILPRKNAFIRPPVANVDNFIITFAAKDPMPDLKLIDKLTAVAAKASVECTICINKIDLSTENAEYLADIYRRAGFKTILASGKEGIGTDELKEVLKDKTSAFSGSSGVGKSTLINHIDTALNLKTGAISDKISRGKHTTRETELFPLDFGGYVFDTPGFSSFELTDTDAKELHTLFPEIEKHAHSCRFAGCSHISEPDCSVKDALSRGEIHESRYQSYKTLYEELKNQKNNF